MPARSFIRRRHNDRTYYLPSEKADSMMEDVFNESAVPQVVNY